MPADRWTARSYSVMGRADRNSNTAGATSAPSSSVLTRSGGECSDVESALSCSVNSLSAEKADG